MAVCAWLNGHSWTWLDIEGLSCLTIADWSWLNLAMVGLATHGWIWLDLAGLGWTFSWLDLVVIAGSGCS